MKSHSTFELSFFDNFGENFSFHLTFVISYTNEYCSLTAYISFMLSSLCFAVLITNISDSNQLSIFPITYNMQCDFIQNSSPYHSGCKEQRQKNKTENCLLENDAFVVSHCQMAWSSRTSRLSHSPVGPVNQCIIL